MAIIECGQGHLYDTDQYDVCPYCNGGGNVIDFGSRAGGEIGATVAPDGYMKRQREEDKTVGVLNKKMHIEPVVGWLVCIKGPDKGKDYRIWAKNNTIGRSGEMDICIKGDDTISRENHARLAYDEKHNNFHLIPAENTNNIYLNDEPVYVPTKLDAYDCIEFGNSKLVFLPFCSEKFTWKTGLTEGEKDPV